jgi:2-phosphosulfolactate phosphatase
MSALSVSLEWGEHGAERLGATCDAVVIVDVLSFCTTVDVATARGAVVLPFASRDSEQAEAFARLHGAELASRSRQTTPEQRYSLSPSSVAQIPSGTRLVLPSPNGATLSRIAAAAGATVYAGCLRNASAVAAHLQGSAQRIGVVPAGERWRDYTLRVALEDLLGAGAVVAGLEGDCYVEAALAARTFLTARGDIERYITHCVSGRELIDWGFPNDVALASECDVSSCVPALRDGAYVGTYFKSA